MGLLITMKFCIKLNNKMNFNRKNNLKDKRKKT